MDTNLYTLERQAAMRLDEARRQGAEAALVASLGRRWPDLRALAGLGLIRLGRRLGRRAGLGRRPRRAHAPSLS